MIESIGTLGNITNLQGISDKLQSNEKAQLESKGSEFNNILTDILNNVNETQKATEEDTIKLALGETDDLHTITINSAKAELALLTAVQVRNKLLDAYNELMRISL